MLKKFSISGSEIQFLQTCKSWIFKLLIIFFNGDQESNLEFKKKYESYYSIIQSQFSYFQPIFLSEFKTYTNHFVFLKVLVEQYSNSDDTNNIHNHKVYFPITLSCRFSTVDVLSFIMSTCLTNRTKINGRILDKVLNFQ